MRNIKDTDVLDWIAEEEKSDEELAALMAEERKKMKIGMNIREMRKRAGLTQKELAKRIKTTQSVIARIESADSDLNMATLLKISVALGYELTIAFDLSRTLKEELRRSTNASDSTILVA
ncbi:MAG: helix-turn-helix transcriptional regulator [Candidatus Electryonea clarkiae]|nr:helix-turn-helix transcriptional regulator [Candidatus Electryonea clarkiae]